MQCLHVRLDDPVAWGVLPAHYYPRSRTTRWVLGASDVIFTNPLFSTFFRLGQTLETFRGKGIHQPAVDFAIQQLNDGGWVHLYGEGGVNQPNSYTQDLNGYTRLPRFKWGVGRMIMECKMPPVIIPMWLTGFDQLMPEGRPFPYKYIPRFGAELSVTFGHPIPANVIRQSLEMPPSTIDSGMDSRFVKKGEEPKGWLGEELQRSLVRRHHKEDLVNTTRTPEELSKVRARVTSIVHDAVESLGHTVSGKLLPSSRLNK